MIANIGVTLAGILIFLFIFWKRLKEDYSSEIIFKSAFAILFGIAFAVILALKIIPDWFFFAGIIGVAIGLVFSVFNLRMRFYETFEASVVSLLPWLSFVFLLSSVVSSLLSSFLLFLGTLVLIFVFYYLDTHYKEFGWYKSGRIGFSGLATLGLLFLSRATLAIFVNGMLSFVSQRYESIISGSAAFICFLLIYNLGRK